MQILVRDFEQIRLVTLNKPNIRNAIDGLMADDLLEAMLGFEADSDLKIAVITGAGDHFCAGADLTVLQNNDESIARRHRLEPDGDGPLGPTRRFFSKPIIAAVEGFAVAGGLELALMADLRVASQTAQFGVLCRRFGVPLIDGGTVRLPRIIGMGRALDLILTGRLVDAQEALALGLINRLCPSGTALEQALMLARQIISFPEVCMLSDRLSAYTQWDLSTVAALKSEAHLSSKIVQQEGVAGAKKFVEGAGRHGVI